MKIGTVDLGERPVTLAPMEDVTDASFRILCREAGAAMVTTEFVSSDGLVRDVQKTIAKMHTLEEEAPVAVQIYGSIPEAMVDAARMAANAKELAGGHGADMVDINFGCPVSKIAGRGAGSGMMREPDKMVAITKAIVEAIPDKPVTVKTRLGWDDNSKIIVELAERLQDVGISALTIHGRTRCQMYKGEADWSLIGAVKNNPRMRIPIIGNGDIHSAVQAREAFDKYGVDGIMVGRASFGHPWIFTEIRHLLDTGEELPPMNVQDRVAQGPRHRCVRNAPPPQLLLQRPAGFQRHPHQTGHLQRPGRNHGHPGLRGPALGRRSPRRGRGVRHLRLFCYLCSHDLRSGTQNKAFALR